MQVDIDRMRPSIADTKRGLAVLMNTIIILVWFVSDPCDILNLVTSVSATCMLLQHVFTLYV